LKHEGAALHQAGNEWVEGKGESSVILKVERASVTAAGLVVDGSREEIYRMFEGGGGHDFLGGVLEGCMRMM